ncbi:MAG: hypothetical protein KAS32_31590 [Candidatus Peribacteraceae bacterium]|nr:hypothetical protein [Candidatus Peribacteraceae bacterium]
MTGYTYRLIKDDEDVGFINLCDGCEKEMLKQDDTYLDPWEGVTGVECTKCGCCL